MGETTRTRLGWAAAVVIIAAGAVSAQAAVSVSVDPSIQHQTIRGWAAVFPWQVDVPDRLARQMVNVGVRDLGLNAFRYEGPGSWSTTMTRWEWANDDDDPLHTNWDALNTAHLDTKARTYMIPAKQIIEARGDRFVLQISPSFFDGGSTGSAPEWLLQSPGEYVEWAMTVLTRLRDEHGIEADEYTILNEAGNGNAFTSSVVGRMIKALGPRMEEAGFATKIEFPESINGYVAWLYIQNLKDDPEVWKYVDTISYHLYGGLDYRDDLWAFAQSRGLMTAQTEFMANNSKAMDYLYDDLTIANVSDWSIYGQGFPVADVTGTRFTRSVHWWAFHQIMPYVRSGSVRIGASSDLSTVRPLAFEDDGEVTTVLINTSYDSAAQTVNLSGLPAGEYAVSQSVYEGVMEERGLQTVGSDGLLTLSVAKGAVVTVYPHNDGNRAPEPTHWGCSDAYLRVGLTVGTTLTASAQDSELDPLTYHWSVVDKPAGATLYLLEPDADACPVYGLTIAGEYVFAVDISDGLHTVTREVMIKSYQGNQAPIVQMHIRQPVQVILPVSSATLRGEPSDVEGGSMSYQWTAESYPAGATPTFASPQSTSCVVSGLTVAGDYVFRFSADDGTNVGYNELVVTVEPEDLHAPFISSPSATVAANGCGLLSAVTGDADGDWISHWWEVVSAPTDAKVRFVDQGAPTTPVWTDTPGTYRFKLIVVDRAKSTSSTLTLTLDAASAPIPGDATLDGAVTIDDFVVLKNNFGFGSGWDLADFDSDGDVDIDDFVILKNNFGSVAP